MGRPLEKYIGRGFALVQVKGNGQPAAPRGDDVDGRGRMTEDGKVVKLDVAAGDRVLFSKYAGTEVKIEGVDYLIMGEEDILGVIE